MKGEVERIIPQRIEGPSPAYWTREASLEQRAVRHTVATVTRDGETATRCESSTAPQTSGDQPRSREAHSAQIARDRNSIETRKAGQTGVAQGQSRGDFGSTGRNVSAGVTENNIAAVGPRRYRQT